MCLYQNGSLWWHLEEWLQLPLNGSVLRYFLQNRLVLEVEVINTPASASIQRFL